MSLISERIERASRQSAEWHRAQERRGSGTPYVQHVFAVALILDRAGFPEDVVIGGLLHDAVEDTEATLDQVGAEFGPEVARLVEVCSEVKHDASGAKRPWIDRKTEHLDRLRAASVEARAIALADKLHNLISIRHDLESGRPTWATFHASRDRVLWYYRSAIEVCGHGDPRLEALADECRALLTAVEAVPDGPGRMSGVPG